MKPALRLAMPLAAALALTGCFGYVRSEVGAVPVGDNVRVYLSPQGAAMAELRELSPAAEPIVSGQLVQREASGLMLRVSESSPGFYGASIGQDVRVPSGEILQLERRRLDPLRTTLATAGAAAGIATLVIAIMSDAFGGDAPPGEAEQQLRIPFSIRVP